MKRPLHQLQDFIITGFRPFQFRGKQRLLACITPHHGHRRAMMFQAEFWLDLSDYIQRCLYMGTYEQYEARLLHAYLRPGMTFVDVGANVGYYTALAAHLVGNTGRVIAFEPSPYAYDSLLTLINRNRLQNVQAINAGVSDRRGRLKLYLGKGSTNHSPTLVAHEHADSVEVSVVTLDDISSQLEIAQIDVLKIDVEGYEPYVLSGARRLLAERRVNGILCEFNEAWLAKAGHSSASLFETIKNAGFIEDVQLRKCSDNRFFRLA